MTRKQVTRLHLHAEYARPTSFISTVLWFLGAICLTVLLMNCGGKHFPDPKFGVIKQDNYGLMICRFSDTGTVICDRNLEYYERQGKKVFFFPVPEGSLQ